MHAVTPPDSFSTHLIQVEQNVVPEFIELFTIGIIVLNTGGKVTSLNNTAKQIIKHCKMLDISVNRTLRILDVKKNNMLQKLIAGNDENCTLKKQILVKKTDNNTQVFIQVSQFINQPQPYDQNCIIFIRDISNTNELSIENLTLMFHLTPSETAVTHALANGMNLQEIATQRSRSISTIRSQLKSIFMKTGTYSQQELIRLSYQSLMQVQING